MIPIFVGKTPAIVALFVYVLLPIKQYHSRCENIDKMLFKPVQAWE